MNHFSSVFRDVPDSFPKLRSKQFTQKLPYIDPKEFQKKEDIPVPTDELPNPEEDEEFKGESIKQQDSQWNDFSTTELYKTRIKEDNGDASDSPEENIFSERFRPEPHLGEISELRDFFRQHEEAEEERKRREELQSATTSKSKKK